MKHRPPRFGRHGHPPHSPHYGHPHHGHRPFHFRRSRTLRHQLFFWLGGTILATALVVLVVFRITAFDEDHVPWRVEALRGLVAERFARAWHSHEARLEFAESLHSALGASMRLFDANGNELERVGAACYEAEVVLPISESGTQLGSVQGCFSHAPQHIAVRGLAALVAAVFLLWIAAAVAARRLTLPLSQLIAVTREMGAGNLSARVRLGRQGHGELRLLADSVNDMGRRIEQQLRDQRELLAVVSHEIRSPLARIRLGSELLRNAPQSSATLDGIELEITELDVLLSKLLAHSRLDFGALSLTLVLAGAILDDLLQRRALGVPDSAQDGDTASDSAPGIDGGATEVALWVHVDTTLLKRALDNLLENAERHGASPITARVRTARASERGEHAEAVVFEVIDAGPGIPQTALPHVFDAFSRPTQAGATAAGLGLGLSLVKRIAEAHGGFVFAENLPGGGARVGFTLPAAANDS